MDKAKRAQTAETPKQPSLGLKLRAPYLYPDRAYSAGAAANTRHGRSKSGNGRISTLDLMSARSTILSGFREMLFVAIIYAARPTARLIREGQNDAFYSPALRFIRLDADGMSRGHAPGACRNDFL